MRFLVRTMIQELALPESEIDGRLDELYVDRFLKQVRDSSLDAIRILAQEVPRYDHGSIIESRGFMGRMNTFWISPIIIWSLFRRYRSALHIEI